MYTDDIIRVYRRYNQGVSTLNSDNDSGSYLFVKY